MTLVATNVAARGLDIDNVQLIIQVCYHIHVPCLILKLYWYLNAECDISVQCEATSDVEAYIHRSGRTGRAGELLMLGIACFSLHKLGEHTS